MIPRRRTPGGVLRRRRANPPRPEPEAAAGSATRTDEPVSPPPQRADGMPFDRSKRPLGMMQANWEPSLLPYLYVGGTIAATAFIYIGSVIWGMVLVGVVAAVFILDRAL